MPIIRVDDEVYKVIQDNAEPFKDNPNSSLRELLGLDAYSSKQFSYGARLNRLATALSEGDPAKILRELNAIERDGSRGAFGKIQRNPNSP